MRRKRKDKKTIKKILKYRIRNFSLNAIGRIFHLSRQRIHQIINANKNNPEFKELYDQIEISQEFLKRKIKGEDIRGE